MQQLMLSPAAQDDIADILLYTLQTWGKAQQDIYAEELDKGLALIVENPEIGRARPELYAGCRSFRIQQHIVYYAVLDDTIAIARVLHYRMDSRRYL